VRAALTVRSGGEHDSRATNRTAAGRARNRRVELLVSHPLTPADRGNPVP